jgi:hypothetical protein
MSWGEVGAKVKIDFYIACIMREIQITGQGVAQSSWNPRKDLETKSVDESTSSQKS